VILRSINLNRDEGTLPNIVKAIGLLGKFRNGQISFEEFLEPFRKQIEDLQYIDPQHIKDFQYVLNHLTLIEMSSSPLDAQRMLDVRNNIAGFILENSEKIGNMKMGEDNVYILEDYRSEGLRVLSTVPDIKFAWRRIFEHLYRGMPVFAMNQLDLVTSIVVHQDIILKKTDWQGFTDIADGLKFSIENNREEDIHTFHREGIALLAGKQELLNGWIDIFVLLEEKEPKSAIDQIKAVLYASGAKHHKKMELPDFTSELEAQLFALRWHTNNQLKILLNEKRDRLLRIVGRTLGEGDEVAVKRKAQEQADYILSAIRTLESDDLYTLSRDMVSSPLGATNHAYSIPIRRER